MSPAKKRALDTPARAGRRRGPTKGDLKEAAILDCAWELLGTKPATEITIEELARGAGISRPTFYFYFASRDAVVRALAARVGQELYDTFGAPLVSSSDDPQGVVRAAVAAYMDRWRTEGRVLRAMVPLSEGDGGLRDFWEPISDRMVETIAASIEAEREGGRALPGPPSSQDLARALVAMLWRSGYELSVDQPSAAERRRRVDTLTTVCLRAVYGASPG
ncbi:TetR/AcrR family transcriptional regulator [Iamia sp. SCSIO 61187]|uniref:TetR/AcrR family transcriptional regulator n=1 Tax=Iamia sp. SCSIO 61187 TaxID=2722752 RepID=UPI001C62B838|nr:TetR/AcrR family transcriptional regulator [Iamia sp. SCSIO 61187]QYG93883.1 TetR/AcrR family transcriptional regulator [Iamia sp. SCSIO 61187]